MPSGLDDSKRICRRPRVLLDGGHNPGAARALADFIREEFPGRRLRLVYASMRDKAMGEIGDILFPMAEEVYLTHPDQTRAASPEEILAALSFRTSSLRLQPDPIRALVRGLRRQRPGDGRRVGFWIALPGRGDQEGSRRGKLGAAPFPTPSHRLIRPIKHGIHRTTSHGNAFREAHPPSSQLRAVAALTNPLIYLYTAVCGTISLLGSIFDTEAAGSMPAPTSGRG